MPKWSKMLCTMLSYKSMEACIFIRTCSNSSNLCSTHPIPSTTCCAWSTPYLTYIKGVVPVGELSSGGGPYSMAGLGNIVRMVSTTTSLILQNAAPVPIVPLGLRGSLSCHLKIGMPASAHWTYVAVARVSHLIELQC
jgi:hypothetical protein